MALLYLCAFLMDAASSALTVSRSPLGMLLHASAFDLGLLGTAATIPYIASTVLFGRLSDRFGRPKLILAAVLVLIPLFLVMPASRTTFQFGVLLALWSFFLGAYWPPLQAWIGDLRPAGRVGRALGWFNLGWSMGVAVGSLTGGLLFRVAPSLPFRFSLICCLLIALLISVVWRRPAVQDNPSTPAPVAAPAAAPGNGRLVYLGWITNAAGFFVFGATYSLFPRLAAQLAPGTALWPWLAFTLAAARMLGFLALMRFQSWLYRPAALLTATVALGGAMLVVASARAHWLFFVAFAVVGLCIAFSYSWSMLHSIENQPQRGRTASYHESILRLGDSCGGFLAGATASEWGLRAPYYLCAAVLGLTTASHRFILRHSHSRDAAASP